MHNCTRLTATLSAHKHTESQNLTNSQSINIYFSKMRTNLIWIDCLFHNEKCFDRGQPASPEHIQRNQLHRATNMGNTFQIDVLSIEWRREIVNCAATKKLLPNHSCGRRRRQLLDAIKSSANSVFRMQRRKKILSSNRSPVKWLHHFGCEHSYFYYFFSSLSVGSIETVVLQLQCARQFWH